MEYMRSYLKTRANANELLQVKRYQKGTKLWRMLVRVYTKMTQI